MLAVYVLLCVIAVLLLIVLVRTFAIKRTLKITDNYPILEQKEEEALFNDLSKMLSIKTIDKTIDCEESFSRYENVLREMFPIFYSHCESIDVDGAFLYKFAGSVADGLPTLILAHSDVVEENGEWQSPAFTPTLRDHKIYARGTIDNKGMVYACFSGIEKFLKEGNSFKNDVYIMSTKNEESTGYGATQVANYFRSKGLKFAVILDEGGAVTCDVMPGIKNDIALLGLCEKGYFDIKFSAKSKGGHSGSPLSSNPFHRLSKFVCKVEKKGYFKVSMIKTVKEMFAHVSPYLTFPLRLLLGNLWLFMPIAKAVLPAFSPSIGAMMKTTIVFTRAEGSNSNNVIPQTASMTANIRNLPTESAEKVLAKLKKTADKFDIDMEVLYAKNESSFTSAKSNAVLAISNTIKQTMPGTIVCSYVTIGATDCCLLDEFSPNIIRFNPIRATSEQIGAMHGIDENIGVSEVGVAVEFFYNYSKGI